MSDFNFDIYIDLNKLNLLQPVTCLADFQLILLDHSTFIVNIFHSSLLNGRVNENLFIIPIHGHSMAPMSGSNAN